MPQTDTVNRRIVLASRPSGLPGAQNFRLEQAEVPTPGPGQVLLRTEYLSLDPYMRNLMEELRSNGVDISGPSTFNQSDRQAFAAALDRLITKYHRIESQT